MSEDINVTDGTVLECLNNKVDLDGGNYVGSPLEQYIHEHCGGGGGGGLEIGDIGIAPLGIDEAQNKRRYINGQLIMQEQFVSFTKKVKEAIELFPSIACTEEEWQATVTMSTYGQCGKFVIDDEAGTIRLPKITGFIQGLTDLASLGELVSAGLPQHNHSFSATTSTAGKHKHRPITDSLAIFNQGGGGGGARVWYKSGDQGWTSEDGAHTHTVSGTTGNASNGVYGKSTTVQPEAIRYPYFIQVATGAEETVDVTREIELNNPFFFGYYQYFEVTPNNTSWLKSEGQWNNKEVYPDYYDWVLTNANNGVANFKLSTDTYDDYSWVVNTADETFRLPLKTKNTPFKVTGADTTLSMGAVSIKGNGMSLGLMGVDNSTFVLYNGSDAIMVSDSSAYGVALGTSAATKFTKSGSVGVTTDASKSGLTGSVSGTATTVVNWTSNTDVSLYFYVGETTQNANLVNVGRIEESLAKKLDISTVRYDSSTSTLFIGVL